jgi:hypothetical protein
MAKLDTLKNAKHETIKNWIVQVLRDTESGRSNQDTLVRKICSMRGVSTLRGTPRTDFAAKVNKAIGAMLREKPPRIERCGAGLRSIRLI